MKRKEKPSRETLDQWHDDPSNWRYGIFYYNKNDTRIFSPKRFHFFGWTINFANPYTYLLFLGIIAITFLFAQLLTFKVFLISFSLP